MSSAETGAGKDSMVLQAGRLGEVAPPSPIVTVTSDDDSSAAVMTTVEGHKIGIGTATVIVDEIGVSYRAPPTDAEDLRTTSVTQKTVTGMTGYRPKVRVEALKNISFVARAGGSVGILRRNRAGKSTLLRAMGGSETPASETVSAHPTPVLLDVSAALVPNLSDKRNVHLGCLAVRLTPQQIEAIIPEVIELAGIGRAIYRSVKTYPSGMASRLRFVTTTTASPDALLIDEALSTGDTVFEEHSEIKMIELWHVAGTVSIVNHATQVIEKMYTRVLWLTDGEPIDDGPGSQIIHDYWWWFWNIAEDKLDKAATVLAKCRERWKPAGVQIQRSESRTLPY